MNARIKRGVAAAAAMVAAAAMAVGFSGSSSADGPNAGLSAFGITGDGRLMAAFDTSDPTVLNWVRVAQPFCSGDTALIGIDVRVQDGHLYAVGNGSLSGGLGCIYTVERHDLPTAGRLTKVSQLTKPLNGAFFGVDFNPAADRLRIISNTGQNLRHNLNDHTTTMDPNLSAGPGQPTITGVTAAAYTNNDLNGDTVTTLFDINTHTDQVVIQSPANNGFLAPTGSLGVDADINAGFDIYAGLSGGKTVSNSGFAALAPTGGTGQLYTVNMLTGAATLVDAFPLDIRDIAVDVNQT